MDPSTVLQTTPADGFFNTASLDPAFDLEHFTSPIISTFEPPRRGNQKRRQCDYLRAHGEWELAERTALCGALVKVEEMECHRRIVREHYHNHTAYCCQGDDLHQAAENFFNLLNIPRGYCLIPIDFQYCQNLPLTADVAQEICENAAAIIWRAIKKGHLNGGGMKDKAGFLTWALYDPGADSFIVRAILAVPFGTWLPMLNRCTDKMIEGHEADVVVGDACPLTCWAVMLEWMFYPYNIKDGEIRAKLQLAFRNSIRLRSYGFLHGAERESRSLPDTLISGTDAVPIPCCDLHGRGCRVVATYFIPLAEAKGIPRKVKPDYVMLDFCRYHHELEATARSPGPA